MKRGESLIHRYDDASMRNPRGQQVSGTGPIGRFDNFNTERTYKVTSTRMNTVDLNEMHRARCGLALSPGAVLQSESEAGQSSIHDTFVGTSWSCPMC
ncbi:hypothetical protein [Burkholderia sp. GS2Y]|uniref:Uncharacterized protein n=1 Tax=Burkholderia theae TaxID=3143496 RepID=A0ABU9WUN0_9BURK